MGNMYRKLWQVWTRAIDKRRLVQTRAKSYVPVSDWCTPITWDLWMPCSDDDDRWQRWLLLGRKCTVCPFTFLLGLTPRTLYYFYYYYNTTTSAKYCHKIDIYQYTLLHNRAFSLPEGALAGGIRTPPIRCYNTRNMLTIIQTLLCWFCSSGWHSVITWSQ